MPQELPPIEQDTSSSIPVPPLSDIAGTPSTSVARAAPAEATEAWRLDARVPEVSVKWPSTSPAGLRALRSIGAALPGTRILRLLAHQPAEDGEAPARFTEICAIHNGQNRGLAGPEMTKALEPPALAMLSEGIAARIARTEPAVPILHLPGMLVILCRNDHAEVKGALAAEPDTFGNGTKELTPAMVSLISMQIVLALELQTSAPQMQQRLAEIAADEARAREAFISFAAHELRAPLTSIKGYAQLLVRQSRKHPLPDPMIRSIQSIEQQSGRMAEMLSEMMDASRILHGEIDMLPSTLDLAALIKRLVERRRVLLPEHNLIVIGADSPLLGWWDGGRVEQVLRDLLDNAARHSPGGSSIVVEMTHDNHSVTVTVRDQGIGIAEPDRDHLFTYLSQTTDSVRRNLSGLGLGLFVSRYLIERLGGRLWLEASSITPPTGSEFAFTLPL